MMRRRRPFLRVLPLVHRRVGADQMAVTKGGINAANGWPIFIGLFYRMACQPVAGFGHAAGHQP